MGLGWRFLQWLPSKTSIPCKMPNAKRKNRFGRKTNKSTKPQKQTRPGQQYLYCHPGRVFSVSKKRAAITKWWSIRVWDYPNKQVVPFQENAVFAGLGQGNIACKLEKPTIALIGQILANFKNRCPRFFVITYLNYFGITFLINRIQNFDNSRNAIFPVYITYIILLISQMSNVAS